ncbi:acyl-CoA dehydrogenase C-terminal domain-containing protein [Ferrimonas balearica]|uniref:acyl-CoA dehydrogenase C-terminal domain-containing protein n=1 Tax=Ferrimonas balearica TaxID=44012 RepID=UPI001F34EE35|nr:acyl-CoA dehydrogenase C-terminal domain-containing protein [Ferrimonas balearica]MBY6095087.1 acyl-CoA dehydrogenase C-terminal domain-containing protein [Ferrimonas balearica]
MHYKAPVHEMQFLLDNVFQAGDLWQTMPELAEMVDMDTAMAILDEGARITHELVAPLNRSGDEEGVGFANGVVTTPKGYKEAYATFAESGWVGLGGEPEFGGMGMPKMLGVLFDEMCYGASNAFALYSSLTAGAALCIASHGSDELKQRYLPMLYSGQWSGAMDMTEPQAGSDLRHIRTKAVPQEDGSYRVSGTKIFITGGDHDLTENVIHLVLAKLPDAPGGSRGLSLFLVPKFEVADDGSVGGPNGVECGSVEHKMGIKASATCVINFSDAKGYLVGQVNRGLAAMFTMMNYERLSIGIQGLGCAEAGFQMARDYALERKQGQGSGQGLGNGADPIIVHGDVRRMLMQIAALTEAGRALAVLTGQSLDKQKHLKDAQADDLVGLLVPLAKAFFTDTGLESSVAAQQVFGGHGYVRETGVEQLVRDVRIAQIYEGTNGIQALDLLGRKVLPHDAAMLKTLIAMIEADLAETGAEWAEQAQLVRQAFGQLLDAAGEFRSRERMGDAVNAAAVDYLHAMGYATYGYLWLKMVNAAERDQASLDAAFVTRKQAIAKFYFARIFPRFHAHLASARASEQAVMALSAEQF